MASDIFLAGDEFTGQARMAHFLEELNPEQRAAVEHTEGPLLILAGAGSGKTRVITYRIAYLIEARGVRPENILALTFTNKAADQMKGRVAKLPSSGLERAPHISTFHSFCVRVLRCEIERLGYTRGFSIYDEDDQQRTIKAAIEELGLGEQVESPRAAMARISFAKNRGVTPAEMYQQAADPLTEKLASLYERYELKLRRANALDFDDLLLKTVNLFRTAPEVCQAWNKRFRYILVDEYQDTNRVQYQLIRLLTLDHRNLCVVGDEDQSIYRWRGADIENILSFEKDYPDAKVIRLEQNYRSTQLILDAATAVVSHNLERKGKTLRTDRGLGQPITFFEAWNAEEEALVVASQVAQALAVDGAASVAVLYRTNAQSRAFEEALRLGRIDHRVVGGFSFYARAEIKGALAYAYLANNDRDSVSFLRIVNTPPRGIGETTVSALKEIAQKQNLSLWEALEQELAAPSGSFSPRALKALEGFYQLMKETIQGRDSLPLSQFFKLVVERSGYFAMLRAENTPESEDRIDNLKELISAAAQAEERGETLAEFLDHAALVSDTDDFDERARVTLMTLHSAKGLEFSTVILAGLEEGLFPHKLCLEDEAALEEERRLCYVGMTRAQDRLILTCARARRSYGQEASVQTRPSRFLEEVPRELLEPSSFVPSSSKPRTSWANAVNSVPGAKRFLKERGRVPSIPQGPGEASRAQRSAQRRWKLGAHVRHPKYGVGTVLGCEGEGEDTKLTVSFPDYGQKKLLERYASLEKL